MSGFEKADMNTANRECGPRPGSQVFDNCPACSTRVALHCVDCKVQVTGCVTGDSIVSPKLARTARKTLWFGDLITICLASGKSLTGTSDHHILTHAGWLALESVSQGDYAITTSIVHNNSPISLDCEPDVQRGPTKISDFYDSLPDSRKSEGLSGLSMDLNDKRENSNVSVVDANRLLRDGMEPFLFKPTLYNALSNSDSLREVALLALSDPLLELCTSHSAGASSVSRSCNGLPVFDGSLSEANLLSFASSPNGNASINQPRSNGCSCQAESLTKSELGLSIDVTTDKIVNVDVVSAGSTNFGHVVYDLSTPEGWYSANDVIVHNCLCTEQERFGRDEAWRRAVQKWGHEAAKERLSAAGFWVPDN